MTVRLYAAVMIMVESYLTVNNKYNDEQRMLERIKVK